MWQSGPRWPNFEHKFTFVLLTIKMTRNSSFLILSKPTDNAFNLDFLDDFVIFRAQNELTLGLNWLKTIRISIRLISRHRLNTWSCYDNTLLHFLRHSPYVIISITDFNYRYAIYGAEKGTLYALEIKEILNFAISWYFSINQATSSRPEFSYYYFFNIRYTQSLKASSSLNLIFQLL